MWTRDVLAILLGYLLGSLPFAYLLTRWRTGLNIREVGEGNVGGRNVWHVVGPAWGILATCLDVAKGSAAVLLARVLGASAAGALLAGPAAIVGHAFPLFLRFRGGKGVSTTAGVVLVWMPWSTLTAAVLFGLAQLLFRDFNKSVVVAIVAGVVLPLAFGYSWMLAAYAAVLFSSLALKKWLDRAHERQVWAASGWSDGGLPGFHSESPEGEQSEETAEMGKQV